MFIGLLSCKMLKMIKPINAKWHGIIDYAFAAIQLLLPKALKLNKKVVKAYELQGTGFLTVNALTDTPVGIKPVLSLKTHQKIDAAALSSLALLTASKMIRKDKKALTFHLIYFAVATTNFLLTNYDDIQASNKVELTQLAV
jgi:hypothetical protein